MLSSKDSRGTKRVKTDRPKDSKTKGVWNEWGKIKPSTVSDGSPW